jgi:hypothetical protein
MADERDTFDDLPVLKAIGEQIVAAARREESTSTAAEPRRIARLRFPRRRSRRLLTLLVLTGGLAGGAAFAATRLIQTGEPVPARPRAQSQLLGAIVPGTTRLLSVRAPDPDGGPPWGLRVFRTKHELACVQVGRVVDGKLGVLGQDGAFHDDGRFHELPVAAEGCGSLDANGQMFMSGGANTQTASGYDGSGASVVGGCETTQDRQLRMDAPRTLRDALRLQLRRREYAAARVQRRVIARYERRARQKIALCPQSHLRDVIWGFEGPLAQKVTLAENRRTRTVIPSTRESGAYLAVLRGNFGDHQRLQRRTYYPGGIICGRGFGVHPTAGCSPPPGLTPQPRRPPPRPPGVPAPPPRPRTPPPALHLPITVFPGLAIRFTPPFDGHRYSVILRCRPNLSTDAYPAKVIPSGRPRTLRLRGPLPAFCDHRPTGIVTDATTGRQLGTFQLRPQR